MEREEDHGFTVSDRRGTARESATPTAPAASASPATGTGTHPESDGDPRPPRPPDLSGLLLSLASTALMHLGAPTPDGGTSPVNLPRAQDMIDLLAVLEEKTRGNLTADESALLGNILYTLRLRYVEQAR